MLLPEPAVGFAALLGVDFPDVTNGAPLPLLWHWLYLLDRPATEDLGPDGHPVRNVIPTPPAPGRRRMFAGGRVEMLGPLRCGEPATRRTEIAKTVDKHGRSGPMTLVTVRHEISQRGRLVVHEEQDIVYRSPTPLALPGAEDVAHRADDWHLDTTPPLLFRYSALTYNGHRIHYDRDYARDVEGYPGLVVHGPLQAMLMTEWVRRNEAAPARRVEFRLVAPAFDSDGLLVGADESPGEDARDVVATSVRTRQGRRTATALVALAS